MITSHFVSCLQPVNWLSEICKQLLDTFDSPLVPCDLSVPLVSGSILNQFLFNAPARPEAWSISRCGHKRGAA
jgi:hypothetical protein